jgi:hypothetical protein
VVQDKGIPTSALLQMLKERGCRVSYPTFIKWRQEDLIPDPILDQRGRPQRRGLGRGLGRGEAQWPPAVLEQVEQICRLRQKRFRFDEIAVELWLSGFEIPVERVRRALLYEWERYLGLFETQVYRLRQKASGQEDSTQAAVDRMARKVARRRPGFVSLPRREQRATVAAWRLVIAFMVFGADQAAETQDGQRLAMTLGLPKDFITLMQGSQGAQWLRGAVKEKALGEVLNDPASAADLLAQVLPQARFFRFIAELPESLTDGPAHWARTLRFMKLYASMGPRSFGIGMLLIKTARGGEDPEFSNVAATVEAMVKEMSQASPFFAAEFMSAAQKIFPEAARKGPTEKRR